MIVCCEGECVLLMQLPANNPRKQRHTFPEIEEGFEKRDEESHRDVVVHRPQGLCIVRRIRIHPGTDDSTGLLREILHKPE